MKKVVFLLMIVFAVVFIASCVFDSVHYCPYCGSGNVKKSGDDVYTCGNSSCGKTFGATGITDV